MFDFIDDEISGKKINPILKFLINILAGDMKNPAPLDFNVNFCRLIGIWLRKAHFKQDLIRNIVQASPQSLTLSFLLANLGLNLNKFSAVVENLSFTAVGFLGMYLNIAFMSNTDRYEDIVQKIRDLNQQFSDGNMSFSTEKKLRFITAGFANYVCSGVIVYASLPYFITR